MSIICLAWLDGHGWMHSVIKVERGDVGGYETEYRYLPCAGLETNKARPSIVFDPPPRLTHAIVLRCQKERIKQGIARNKCETTEV